MTASLQRIGRTRKRLKLDHLVPILYAQINIRKSGKPKYRKLRTLLDTGASASVIASEFVNKLKLTKADSAEWNTAAGNFVTRGTCKIQLQLPELSPTATIHTKFHVHTGTLGNYDLIIGRELLEELGIDILYSSQQVVWPTQYAELPMKPIDCTATESFFVQDPTNVQQLEVERMSSILDAKYSPANLEKVVNDVSTIGTEDKTKLLALLQEHELLFDGTLGKWRGKPYHIDLKEGATPYHGKPYPVPKAYEETLKKELKRLVNIGVLKKVNRSEWAFPSFIIPKKDHTVRFINNLIELNKRIVRRPYPLPKISEMLLKLEGFQWATSLDLNMGYYHIRLDAESKKLCTLIFPWGKYEMQCLPMGLCNSPDIFQEKMSTLMEELNFVRTYIDDLLVITKSDFNDHLEKLDQVLQRISQAGLKINAVKSAFCQTELEYLGYWITREAVTPLPKKVQAILDIAQPKTKRQLRRFIGIVNYYRDSWIRRSDLLSPLTTLSGKKAKWKWTSVHTKAFETMKKVVANQVQLSFPDFNKPFQIYTDASDIQLGAVVAQDNKPIAFFSRKLNKSQLNYTVTEKELLSIVEVLKEFRTILLGQQITVYTDHKNLTYKVFNTDRVMRWRLIIEEYGPTLKYVPGDKNLVADALSRLPKLQRLHTACQEDITDIPPSRRLHEAFAWEKDNLPDHAFPISFKLIQKYQKLDKKLLQKAKNDPSIRITSFRGGDKCRDLLCHKDKIIVPEQLQVKMVQWYHEILCHPGVTRTEMTINRHFTWTNLKKTVQTVCDKCETCRRTKRRTSKYGKIPVKEPEGIPWEQVCVDLIGPYTIPRKKKKDLTLWAMTMIDPATGWFEIAEITTKRADNIANILEQVWLTRYPWPKKIIYDRGTEFKAEFKKMVQEDYMVVPKPITKRNPQANGIVERVHQTIGNMVRTFSVQDNNYIDENDPWSGILAAVAFAVRATVHTTTQASPSQLVFGRDAMYPINHQANWTYIQDRKKKLILANNERENKSRKEYEYHNGQVVYIKQEQSRKYGTDTYAGPATVTRVHDNGTVRVRFGNLEDTYNIRQLEPLKV